MFKEDSANSFDIWLDKVRDALRSINMPLEPWQERWAFDFRAEFEAGREPARTAERANHFWWYEQNKALQQDCRRNARCWLPRGHDGECQPVS
jgi:hypothetical protein